MSTRRLSALSAVSLVISGSVLSSAVGGTQGASSPLPDHILLRLRYKAGDVYTSQTVEKDKLSLSIAGDEDKPVEKVEPATENRVEQTRIRAVRPDGLIVEETRTLHGTKRNVEDGKTTTSFSAPEAWRSLLDSRNRRLRRVSLLPPAQRQSDDDTSVAPPEFPVGSLRVGDTWNGTLPVSSTSLLKRLKVGYQAHLEAIERYQHTPCAQIVYAFDSLVSSEQIAALKGFPKEAKITGPLTVSGSITEWIALDSGHPLHSVSTLTMNGEFVISLKDATGSEKRTKITFAGDVQKMESVTQHPLYNAAVVNTEPGRKAVSSGHRA